MDTTLERRELKRIMRRYFVDTARLLYWRSNEAMEMLQTRILELMLEIQDRQAYLPACLEVLRNTASLQTMADCNILKINMEDMTVEESSFYDMKADNLKFYKIEEIQNFDMDILLMDNRHAVIQGDPGGLRLAALLSWLGLDPESTPKVALRYWKAMAYTGDYFAMKALAYAYAQLGDETQSALWQQVREIFAEADREFSIVVPAHYLESGNREAANTAQVILAVRRRCTDDGKENLPVMMLQYAMDSQDDVETKIRNLDTPSQDYAMLLSLGSRHNRRPLGFAI